MKNYRLLYFILFFCIIGCTNLQYKKQYKNPFKNVCSPNTLYQNKEYTSYYFKNIMDSLNELALKGNTVFIMYSGDIGGNSDCRLTISCNGYRYSYIGNSPIGYDQSIQEDKYISLIRLVEKWDKAYIRDSVSDTSNTLNLVYRVGKKTKKGLVTELIYFFYDVEGVIIKPH